MKSAASVSVGFFLTALRVAAMARSTTARFRSYSTCNDGLIAFWFALIVESSLAIVWRYERSPGSSLIGCDINGSDRTGSDFTLSAWEALFGLYPGFLFPFIPSTGPLG